MPINRKTTPNKSASVLAPQRQQVIDLARDGLAQTQTVRECLQRRDLAERAVVIVDEAGQIDWKLRMLCEGLSTTRVCVLQS